MAGAAGAELLLTLDSTRWLGRVVRGLRLVCLVDLIYRGVSRSRPWLGRLVPDKPGPHRLP